MSYLGESEYDEGLEPEGRNTLWPGGRATQPARPAWDAATYGTPEDLHRARVEPPPMASGWPSYRTGRGEDAYLGAPPAETYHATDSQYPAAAEASPYLGAEPTAYPAGEPTTYPAAEPTAYPAGEPTAYPAEPTAYPVEPSWYPGVAPDPPAETAPTPGDATRGNGRAATAEPMWDEPPAHDRDTARYPGGLTDPAGEAGEPPNGRAGRNLPAAIAVGLGLGIAVVSSLVLWRPAFLGVLILAVGGAVWELVRAVRARWANPPLLPLLAGSALMAGLAWWGGGDALVFGLVVTVLAVMAWRFADGVVDYGRDVTAAALVAVYVPFLAGFAALLASAPADGDLRVLVTLAGVVLSDTGGYAAGVFFGRHSMAPSVSPKKSWEGLAGSLLAAAIGSAVLLYLLFDVNPWWGVVFGIAVSAAAVLGDLGESMIKRDLRIKDMSSLLPGHGGLMDRLDSILLAAPTAYALLVVIAPPA